MSQEKIIDHLFRHQYGKMVAVLTRIFGLSNLETVEDAVQDTFISAMLKWRRQLPEQPEAWLMKAAKNRAIDLLRKIKADQNRVLKLEHGPAVMTIDRLFLEHEIEDSQLRMIFTACHPDLQAKDQIAFALKTISGFSTKEIASALLLKNDTVKKRLTRARQAIQKQGIVFSLPDKKDLRHRLQRVHEILYLIFNEGFHSNNQDFLIRKDLCGEAIRLSKMILKKELLRTGSGYALFALMCFQASRLESKVSVDWQSIDLENQDRSRWYFPLIQLGNEAMHKSMEYEDFSSYHLEAAICVEHLSAPSFADTNWTKIIGLYQRLYELYPTPMTALNMVIVHLQLDENKAAFRLLQQINPAELSHRVYLYHGAQAEYFKKMGQISQALKCIKQALETVSNTAEKNYLLKKKQSLLNSLNS